MSADSQAPDYANPQDLNLYSYVHNNPIRYNDPTGHCIPGIGDCVFTGSANWGDGAAYATGVVEGAASVVEGVVMAPVAIAQAVTNPAAVVQGLQDQAATVVRGAQFLSSDPSGAAAALNDDPHAVGRVLGQAAGTAALAAMGGEGGTCSFSSDTPVATNHGEQSISTLQVGDQVLAYNQTTERTGSYTITAVLMHRDPILVHLTIDDEQIETTPEHPFFTQERGWIGAGELRVGEYVRRISGGYGTVQDGQMLLRPKMMYNLTVAVAHTFFVGTGRWLVHNTCGGSTIEVRDLDPLHSPETSGPRPNLARLSDSELMDSVNRPINNDPIRINTNTGKVIDGNGRAYELLRRATDPRSSITPNTKIPYKPYTPYMPPDP